MAGPKLLIVDDNEDFRLALATHLAGQYSVSCCGNGLEALQLLESGQFSYLVLDVLLPEIDGITLLYRILQDGICPKTLLLTPLVNDYILDSAYKLGIGYIIRKPCSLQAVAERLRDLNQPLSIAVPADPRIAKTAELLIKLSFLPKHKGFPSVREAVLQLIADPAQGLTKEVYPAVGERLNRSAGNVERTIRSAITYAWNHRDALIWETCFPGCTGCPTNAVFLSAIAEILRQSAE